MPGITGMGLTFNLPNFVGDLFQVTPSDTPFLASIGGLTGGEMAAGSTLFQWQGFDLRTPDQRTKVEGANAPAAENRVRFNVTNVVQVHQEAIDISYTKLAAVGQYATTGGTTNQVGISGSNPVSNEEEWQLEQMLKQIARDAEFSFIQGQFANPPTNDNPRKTRGILEAIETNVIANAPDTDLDEAMVLNLMQQIWEEGGIQEQETATVMANAWQKRQLTSIFITDKNYREESRNVGGVSLQTFETDFGRLNIMLNRYMPKDQVAVVSLEECAPVILMIPGKGFLFVEPLAKIGSSERSQIYGEIGLKYGNERKHGKITGLSVGPALAS